MSLSIGTAWGQLYEPVASKLQRPPNLTAIRDPISDRVFR